MAESNNAREALTEAEQLRRRLVAEKRAQAAALLQQHDIDCWLTFAREGSDLLLPFLIGNEEIVGASALMVFVDGTGAAVVADYDIGQVDGLYDDVRPYSLDWREPFQAILQERQPARIGINYSEHDHGVDGLTYGLHQALVNALDPIGMVDRLVTAEPVAAMVRAIKTPEELERMRRAAAITQRIFDDLTGMLKPGLAEVEVYEIVVERMQTYELTPAWDATYCPTVATSRTRSGHNPPGATRIEPGDALRVDFGVVYDGYASDMQRTWYFRRAAESGPPAELIHAYKTVRDGIRMAAEMIRPGKRGYEIDEPVRQYVSDRGYTFTHALGHQLGRLAHDGGMLLGPRNARYGARSGGVMAEGMVFTLEPVIGPIGLEDDVVVTANGCEFFVEPPEGPYIL
ncbi:MAG: M24 family metallopeptidase [Thermomicrobiales bacterium]